jgi:hypothetical protein
MPVHLLKVDQAEPRLLRYKLSIHSSNTQLHITDSVYICDAAMSSGKSLSANLLILSLDRYSSTLAPTNT